MHLPCDSFSFVFLGAKQLRGQKFQLFPGFLQFHQCFLKLQGPLLNPQLEIVMGDSEFFLSALQLAYISPGGDCACYIPGTIPNRTGAYQNGNPIFAALLQRQLLVRRDLPMQCGFPDRLQQT